MHNSQAGNLITLGLLPLSFFCSCTMAWLGIAIGNTHIRWGWWAEGRWAQVELYKHNQLDQLPTTAEPVVVASVVPWLTEVVQGLYPQAWHLTLADVPIKNMYATLGIDRALGAWGAVCLYSTPVLVIDCGTAVSFTAVAADGSFYGGAIMAGLGLHLQSLAEGTALPAIAPAITDGLTIWADTTPTAILSGVFYSTCAGLQWFSRDWLGRFPRGRVVLTGGDGALFQPYIPASVYEPNLVLIGMANCIAPVARML
ncbi:MAG: type III pantothenate kinase [Pseudanabaenaceae cyanobacterium]